MTIANVVLDPQRRFARICVDTSAADVMRPDGARVTISKLAPIPHLSSVIAGRGVHATLLSLMVFAMSASGSNADDLADEIDRRIAEADALAEKAWRANGSPTGAFGEGHEVFLIGWSPTRGVRADLWQKIPGGDAFQHYELDADNYALAGPNDPSFREFEKSIDTIAGLVALARAQHVFMNERRPDVRTGGDLQLAQVDADGAIHVRTLCDLDAAPETRSDPRITMLGAVTFGGAAA